MKTIKITEETHLKLTNLKICKKFKTLDKTIKFLLHITEYDNYFKLISEYEKK